MQRPLVSQQPSQLLGKQCTTGAPHETKNPAQATASAPNARRRVRVFMKGEGNRTAFDGSQSRDGGVSPELERRSMSRARTWRQRRPKEPSLARHHRKHRRSPRGVVVRAVVDVRAVVGVLVLNTERDGTIARGHVVVGLSRGSNGSRARRSSSNRTRRTPSLDFRRAAGRIVGARN